MFKLCLFFCLVAVATAIPAPDVARNKDVEEFKDFLEKTRQGDGATLESRMALNPKAKAWENSGKYQGDILLDDEEVQGMVDSYGSRKAYIWPNTKWPQNTIVYEIAQGHFNAAQRAAILNGIRDIERHTCVRFRVRQPWETNFVRVTNLPDGCYANVGFWSTRGVHLLNLADNCFLHTIIVHEWLHAVGFVHMQSTHDRDFYVRVMWENMQAGMEHNFDKYDTTVVSNLDLPYEYASNMHYGPYGFSINGLPTLLPNFNDFGLMGQQQFITVTDWRRVNRHYNCPGAWN